MSEGSLLKLMCLNDANPADILTEYLLSSLGHGVINQYPFMHKLPTNHIINIQHESYQVCMSVPLKSTQIIKRP